MATEIIWHSCTIDKETHIPTLKMTIDGQYIELNFQPVDFVEVVRCKACKHYRNHPNGLCYLNTEPCDNKQGYKGEAVCVEPDDFCSYGERKNDG